MRGKEFLSRLEAALATLPFEERQAALRYYEEYLLDAGEGNEAEAIAELGAPEALADKIVLESRANAKESAKAQAVPDQSGSEKLSSFSNIELELANASVTLFKGDVYSIALDFPEGYPLPEVDVRGNTLYVKEKKFSHFSFFGFRSFVFVKKGEVAITLPDAQYERFSFDMVNGSLRVPAFRVRELKADSVNGSISVNGVAAECIHLENVNGKLSAQDISTTDSCKCDTVNGGIDISGSIHGKLRAEAVNGGIHIAIPHSGKEYNLNLSTVSGSVRVNGQKMSKSFNIQNSSANSVQANTVNGGIQVEFESGTIVI